MFWFSFKKYVLSHIDSSDSWLLILGVEVHPFLPFCCRPWSPCGGMSPRHFPPGSPHCVLAPSMGPLCRSKPTHRAGHSDTQREGGRDKHRTLTTVIPTSLPHDFKSHNCCSEPRWPFAGCLHPHWSPEPWCFWTSFCPADYSPGSRKYSSRSRAHGMSALHCSSYTMNSHEGQRFSQQSWFFLWIHQTICCELYLLGN